MPAARNASGEAMLALRVATSSGVICGTSMSTRSGSPKADWTVAASRHFQWRASWPDRSAHGAAAPEQPCPRSAAHEHQRAP